MKREYDVSKAERGAFFHPEMKIVPPVHLYPGVLSRLTEHAESKGKTLNGLVNELLKKDIELIEAAK